MPTVDIVLAPERSEDESARRAAAARKLRIPPERIRGLRLLKHSIDARKAPVKVRLRLEVAIDEDLPRDRLRPLDGPAAARLRPPCRHRRLRPGRHVRRPALPRTRR